VDGKPQIPFIPPIIYRDGVWKCFFRPPVGFSPIQSNLVARHCRFRRKPEALGAGQIHLSVLEDNIISVQN
jgi:hypothetical protein